MEQSLWAPFIELIQKSDSAEQLAELLDCLFTAEEKQNINDRISLVAQLLQGDHSQRQIAKNLNISIAKITRGSNMLKQISPELMEFLQEQLTQKKN